LQSSAVDRAPHGLFRLSQGRIGRVEGAAQLSTTMLGSPHRTTLTRQTVSAPPRGPLTSPRRRPTRSLDLEKRPKRELIFFFMKVRSSRPRTTSVARRKTGKAASETALLPPGAATLWNFIIDSSPSPGGRRLQKTAATAFAIEDSRCTIQASSSAALGVAFLFDTAEANAALYSLVGMARANGRNVHEYLRAIFTDLPKATTANEVVTLLPWVWQPATSTPATRPASAPELGARACAYASNPAVRSNERRSTAYSNKFNILALSLKSCL